MPIYANAATPNEITSFIIINMYSVMRLTAPTRKRFRAISQKAAFALAQKLVLNIAV